MTQIRYYGVDTGIPISEKHVLRVKENNGQYSGIIINMHSLTVERSDWYASIQDLNDNFMYKYDITLIEQQKEDLDQKEIYNYEDYYNDGFDPADDD